LIILDVGAGLKGGSPENPQFVSQLRFNHNELYGNGWLAGTHSVYRYKNYVFIGDEVFPGSSTSSQPKRFPYAASFTSSMFQTSTIREKWRSIRCLKAARTTCGLRTM
jgi:hypothetical protein